MLSLQRGILSQAEKGLKGVDWTCWEGCEFVERIVGKGVGRPTIKGTRIERDLLLVEAELARSLERTHEDFPTLPVDTIRTVQAYVRAEG
jgi:uncharacterized protein (DUF433 family)